MDNPAPAAYGQVRLALVGMDRTHRRIASSAAALPSSIADSLAFRGVIARNRAVARLQAAIPDRPIMELERSITWRLLRPRDHPAPDNPTMRKEGVEVRSLTVGLSRGHSVVTHSPWGVFFTRRSLARLYERARPRVDFVKAVEESHDILLASPAKAFNAAHDEESWALPCPAHGGHFLCTVRVISYRDADAMVYLTANTWVDDSMLFPNQVKQAQAILHRGDGPRMAEGLLLPMELRRVAVPTDDGHVNMQFESVPAVKPQQARKKLQSITAEI